MLRVANVGRAHRGQRPPRDSSWSTAAARESSISCEAALTTLLSARHLDRRPGRRPSRSWTQIIYCWHKPKCLLRRQQRRPRRARRCCLGTSAGAPAPGQHLCFSQQHCRKEAVPEQSNHRDQQPLIVINGRVIKFQHLLPRRQPFQPVVLALPPLRRWRAPRPAPF